MSRMLCIVLALAVTPPTLGTDVIILMADDLGWGDLGCYGSDIPTPNLNALATEGALFTHYLNASCVCSPSRAALLTSRWPAENIGLTVDGVSTGIYGWISGVGNNAAIGQADYLDPDVMTIFDVFKDAGYVTSMFGKWHLGVHGPPLSEYGIDEARCTLCPNADPHYGNEGWAQRSSEFIVDDATAFWLVHTLEDRFMVLNFHAPHTLIDPVPDPQQEPNIAQSIQNGWTSTVHCYGSEVRELDFQIGRLLDVVDLDNTIVVFCSDNGPVSLFQNQAGHCAAGQTGPYRGRKKSIYLGGLASPLIIRAPNGTPGVNHGFIASVDLMPTLTALAGVATPLPPNIEGEDLGTVVLDPTAKAVRQGPIFAEWRFASWIVPHNSAPGALIIENGWAFYRNRDASRRELYDLVNDPMQFDNLIEGAWDYVQEIAVGNDRGSVQIQHTVKHTLPPAGMETRLLNWQAGLNDCLGCDEGNNEFEWPN